MPHVERTSIATAQWSAGATVTHTVVAGVSLLVVDVTSRNSDTPPVGVSYAGHPMTFQRGIANGTVVRTSRFVLPNPPEGTGDAVVAAGSTGSRTLVAARSIIGVDPDATSGTATSVQTASPSLTAAAAAADDLVLDLVSGQGSHTLTMGGLAGRSADWNETITEGSAPTHMTTGGSSVVGHAAPTLSWGLSATTLCAALLDVFAPADTEPPPDTDVAALQPNAILAAEGLTPNLATVQQDPETAGGWLAIP